MCGDFFPNMMQTFKFNGAAFKFSATVQYYCVLSGGWEGKKETLRTSRRCTLTKVYVMMSHCETLQHTLDMLFGVVDHVCQSSTLSAFMIFKGFLKIVTTTYNQDLQLFIRA